MSLRPRSTGYRVPAALIALALVASAPTALARDRTREHDHERAQEAVQAGQVMPLETVLARVAREYPGQVLEVELERDHGQWTYEIKKLLSDGQLVKLKVDAKTGEPLRRGDRPDAHR